ncbi:MAG: hypothetical protein JO008_12975, partial [Alphaproteobacteria bacterium]|nr:hypothetical protein [Alphaproteobacteria bacterium]
MLDKATFVAAVTAAIATGFAAWYTSQQWVTADISLRASNRAYINSNSLRLVTHGAKSDDGHLKWIVAPLIENTGNTGTHQMRLRSETTVGDKPIFDWSAGRDVFSPYTILPKSEDVGGVIVLNGDQIKVTHLWGTGIIRYDD